MRLVAPQLTVTAKYNTNLLLASLNNIELRATQRDLTTRLRTINLLRNFFACTAILSEGNQVKIDDQ